MANRPFQKAVVDGRIVYSSVSAVNRFANCERSWWFKYVKGIPDPPGKAAIAGTEGHARLEHYLGTGEDVLQDIERAGLHLLPEPGPGLLLEQKVDGVLDAAGVPFLGAMDLVDERTDMPVLTDFKFKSKIGVSLFALADPDREEGRQMLAYAEAYRRMRPGIKSVYIQHIHFATKGKKRAEAYTHGPVPLDEVKSRWQYVGTKYVAPIIEVAKATRVEDVKPNRGFCYAFHRECPYMAQCPVGAKSFESLFDIIGGNNVGILDQYKKAVGIQPAGPIVPVADQVPTQAVTVEPPKVWAPGADYRLSSGEVGKLESSTGSIGRFLIDGGGPSARWVDSALSTVGEMVLIIPPEAPVSAPVADPAPGHAVEENAPAKKRGRPSKADKLAKDMAEVPAIVAVEADIAQARALPEAPFVGVRLYFGCAPVGVVTQTLHAYVDDIERVVLKTLEETLPDVRLSSHEMLSFGKWKAVLGQAAIRTPPAPGHYVVSSMAGEKLQAVADALVGLLANVPGSVVMR